MIIVLLFQEEIKVDTFLADIAHAYDSRMGNALQKYEKALENMGISSTCEFQRWDTGTNGLLQSQHTETDIGLSLCSIRENKKCVCK